MVMTMTSEILVAIFSLVGTLIGSLAGILAANKLINYRIQQLEKKVDLHNHAIERLYIAEGNIKELQHEIKELKH